LYQDGLGTNSGKALEKEMCFPAGLLALAGKDHHDGISLMLRLRDPDGTRRLSTAKIEGGGHVATLGEVDSAGETVAVSIKPAAGSEAGAGSKQQMVAFSVVAVLG
jgi:hypothetical protein